MAEIDSGLSRHSSGRDKAMGHRTETNRRRHIYTRWKSFLQRARPRTADEAAHLQHRIVDHDHRRWEIDSLLTRRKYRLVPTCNRWLRHFWIDRHPNASARSAAKIAARSRN